MQHVFLLIVIGSTPMAIRTPIEGTGILYSIH